MPSNASSVKLIVIGVGVFVLAGLVWTYMSHHPTSAITLASSNEPSVSARALESSREPARLPDGGHALPHAIRDPAKRDELRKRLLVAMAEAQRAAEEEKAHPSADPNARGNRETNDLKEFGRFVSQAINEDFIPMARGCAKELASRQVDAGGNVRVAFKLLGDTKIGGVVDEAHIDNDKSSLHDEKFETCVRESMYGVYFDPPPAGGEATLNFDLNVSANGEVDEKAPDFSNIRDRRNEKP